MSTVHWILIGEAIILLIIILLSYRSGNVKRTKTAKSEGKSQDKVSDKIPVYGYDPSGRKLTPAIESLAASAADVIQKIEYPANTQEKYDRLRKGGSKKKSKRNRQ